MDLSAAGFQTNAEEMRYVHDLSEAQALILTTDESGNLH